MLYMVLPCLSTVLTSFKDLPFKTLCVRARIVDKNRAGDNLKAREGSRGQKSASLTLVHGLLVLSRG